VALVSTREQCLNMLGKRKRVCSRERSIQLLQHAVAALQAADDGACSACTALEFVREAMVLLSDE